MDNFYNSENHPVNDGLYHPELAPTYEQFDEVLLKLLDEDNDNVLKHLNQDYGVKTDSLEEVPTARLDSIEIYDSVLNVIENDMRKVLIDKKFL